MQTAHKRGKKGRTLLPCLVLLLIRLQQHIIRQRPPRHRTLRTHRMTLTSQRPRTLRPIRQRNTTLLLNIHRSLGLRSLGLRLFLFLLLLRLLIILLATSTRTSTSTTSIHLALLPLLRPILRHPLDTTALLRALLPLHRILAVNLAIPVIVAIDLLLGAVRRVARLLFLPRFFLLRFQTTADVVDGRLFQDRPLARLANHGFDMVFFARFAGGKCGDGLFVQAWEDGRCVG